MEPIEVAFFVLSMTVLFGCAFAIDKGYLTDEPIDQLIIAASSSTTMVYMWLAFPYEFWFSGDRMAFLIALFFCVISLLGNDAREKAHRPAFGLGLGGTLFLINLAVRFLSPSQ